MKGVFISYRRADAAATSGRLRDRFAMVLPEDRIFHDVASIDAGANFVAAIDDAVARSEAMLVIIGRLWADPRSEGARLADPRDFVRAEVAAGLASGVRVIPVLVDGAAMPAEEALPAPLQPLTRLNAFELRNARFGDDADRLIEIVTGRRPAAGPSRLVRAFWALGGAAAGLAAYVAVGVIHREATGAGLDMSIGKGATTLLFPVFAAAGALIGWRFSGRGKRG